jgi:3-methyladenine DNA glycosylase/8-oxoguanine DNA glycosylase/RimJ/RimL family protein N-acetyltransferase
MGMTALISSQRLDLIPMSPAFLEASLAGDEAGAASLLKLSIPADWFRKGELIKLRLEQLRREPALRPWLLRAIGLRQQKLMVGYIGFHTGPDPAYLRDIAPGAIEFGYTVFPAFRRQGYAREACAALMAWAFQEGHVRGFVVSIRPDNTASLGLAQSFGFKRIGSHMDEVDGLEDIYELRLSSSQADTLLAGYRRPLPHMKAEDWMAQTTTLSPPRPYDLPLSMRVAATFAPEPAQDSAAFRSAVRIHGMPTLLEVRQTQADPPRLEVSGGDSQTMEGLKVLAEWMLLTELDLRPFYRVAAGHATLEAVTERLRGLKPTRPASLFEMAVVAITEQQISLSAAYRIRTRLVERFGDCIDGFWIFPEAESLASASHEELMACGLSGRKAEYIGDLARQVTGGVLDLARLKTMGDEEARDFIMGLRGFGRWSADYILVRGLGRPDCVPVDDLGIRTVLGRYLGDGDRMASEQVLEVLEPLAPYRGLAAFYLMADARLADRAAADNSG